MVAVIQNFSFIRAFYFMTIMEENISEIWREVRDYTDYKVSNLGRVRSYKNNKCIVLKPYLGKKGYLSVGLSKNGIQKSRFVHQLVAESFLNHIPNGVISVVNHINSVRHDNSVSNLEIISTRENTNKKQITTNSSSFTGVSWNKKIKKWCSTIFVNGKSNHLGTFNDEYEASEYYESALISLKEGTEIKVKEVIKSSKYKGVNWHKRDNKWVARVTYNGKRVHIGKFLSEYEAYLAIVNYSK